MARPVDPSLRDRLLDAAALEFAERGYAGATMASIGQRAAVTKGGVYFHFRSKEELFFAVLDARRTALGRVLQAAPDAPSGAAALHALCRAYLALHLEDRRILNLMRVLVTELGDRFTTTLREDARHEQRLLRARIRELVVAGVGDGSLFAADPALAAFLIASALRGVLDQWLTSPAEAEPFCRADALAQALTTPYATGVVVRGRQAPADAAAEFRPPF
jgi:AcrR family transcriptional regulator